MGNLGFGELAVILVILLIVVGPSRLPTVMKSTGKAMRTLRQASRDIQTSVGLDEMLREDVLRPPPRRIAPQPPAAGTLPRPAPNAQANAADAQATATAEPTATKPPTATDGTTGGGTA